MSSTMNLSLSQIAQWLPGSRLIGDPTVLIDRVHTDSRSLQSGDLFVALKGERFDAHTFLNQAKKDGACAAIAHKGLQEAQLPGLEVSDSKIALGLVAQSWRHQFQIPVVAVTGSNGKTTVTQMIGHIFKTWAGNGALVTEGNFNNEIGVPLTLMRMRQSHTCTVVELGMNHPGEITQLARMAQPTIALVNNAQREHQEFMQSVQAVATENACVIEALPAHGVAVFPLNDEFTPLWKKIAGQRTCICFGKGGEVQLISADWRVDHWQVEVQTPAGRVKTQLKIAGLHNVQNAMAALACACAAQAPLQAMVDGLASFEPVKGRSRAMALQYQQQSKTLIDDTYNANPDSVIAAIDVLKQLPAPRLLVLGDMGEVGEEGPAFHQEIGSYALKNGIEHVYTLGTLAKHSHSTCPHSIHWDEIDALNQAAIELLPMVSSILVKGSRFMKMERVVQAIEQAAQYKESTCC
ncbi:MAG: UDP-N-acetylmuramoyl-tripeptide--D-alanyl-D-alanine ligase [Limnohabitans sp.]|nr:UDP-N-acetylmuramoyl-tripeptide--D-alanyl-D-alanine ligase [Limnohabitans sp.]